MIMIIIKIMIIMIVIMIMIMIIIIIMIMMMMMMMMIIIITVFFSTGALIGDTVQESNQSKSTHIKSLVSFGEEGTIVVLEENPPYDNLIFSANFD